MSEHSFDPAFDDTPALGRGVQRRSVSRAVEPVVEAHVEPSSGPDDPPAGRGLASRSRASSASGSTRSRRAAACRRRRLCGSSSRTRSGVVPVVRRGDGR